LRLTRRTITSCWSGRRDSNPTLYTVVETKCQIENLQVHLPSLARRLNKEVDEVATRKITDILTPDELQLLKRTISHFLKDPDYATGEETGRSFRTLEFGHPLPLEVVIRDWRAELNEGPGGRDQRNGDCFSIYVKLYEAGDGIEPLLGDIM
jgi:hypothetical protein